MELLIKKVKSQLKRKQRISWFNNVCFGPVFFVSVLSLFIGTKLSPVDQSNPEAGLGASVKYVITTLAFNKTESIQNPRLQND